MAKLTLYHAAPSRSSVTRWMLEEIGEPYDIKLLSLSKGDNQKPDYLAVNPMGKVPALKHGDVVITELKNSTYYARLILQQQNELARKIVEIDARPSDCIALAVQQKSPIFVANKVFSAVEDMTEISRAG